MNRIKEEKEYWESASKDPEVDKKYISDLPREDDIRALGKLEGKILDLGCGVGRLMNDGYYGVDISEGMLEIAKKRKPNCQFKLCDGRTIPYKDSFFDVVYSVLLFQHLPLDGIQSYIDEVHRVLKPGGVFKFQMIEGTENAPFSKHYKLEQFKMFDKFNIVSKNTGLGHHAWTWITIVKK